MKTEFTKVKEWILKAATKKEACNSELRRVENSKTLDELIIIVRENAGWCREEDFLTDKKSIQLFGLSTSNLFNSGNSNSGNWNSGNWNSGYSNSGNCNSGDRNSGNSNSGNCNSGYRNSGNWNSGDRNSGYRNSGNSNSGNCNSGNWNSGNWNSGNWNSGDSNSGYRNSGAFCIDNDPKAILFDKESEMTVREWEQTRAYSLMFNLNPNIWVSSDMMSTKEKKANPIHGTTGGYLKTISIKDAWKDMWGNFSKDDKAEFTNLPNFDSKIFEEITGIKIK